MKIDKRYSHFLIIGIMVATMVFCMSLFISLVNVGLTSNFFEIRTRAFMVDFANALPFALAVSKVSRVIVAKITE